MKVDSHRVLMQGRKKSQDSTCGNICADETGVGSASARPSSAFSCSDKKNEIDEKDLQRTTSDSPCAASWKKSQVDNRVRESPSSQIIARQACARKDAAEEYDRNVAASSKPPIQSVKPPSQTTPCAKKSISAEKEFRSSTSPCAKVNDEKRESVLRSSSQESTVRSSGIKSEFDKNENKDNDIKSMCKSSSPNNPVSKLSVCDSRIAQSSCHQDKRTTKQSVSSTSASVQEQHFASKVQEEERASTVQVVATPKMQEQHVTKVQEPDISSFKEVAVEEDKDGDFFSQGEALGEAEGGIPDEPRNDAPVDGDRRHSGVGLSREEAESFPRDERRRHSHPPPQSKNDVDGWTAIPNFRC